MEYEIEAIDDGGNKYKKKLVLWASSEGKMILSFGGSIEYDLSETFMSMLRDESKEFLVIDMMGRNHKGEKNVKVHRNDILPAIFTLAKVISIDTGTICF